MYVYNIYCFETRITQKEENPYPTLQGTWDNFFSVNLIETVIFIIVKMVSFTPFFVFTVRNGLTWVHCHILRPLFSGYTKNGFIYTIFLLTVTNGLSWEDLSSFSALKHTWVNSVLWHNLSKMTVGSNFQWFSVEKSNGLTWDHFY